MIYSPLKYTTEPYIPLAIPMYSSLFESKNTFDVESFYNTSCLKLTF